MNERLHSHEVRILRFLEQYWLQFLRPPSVEDIQAAVGMLSKDHVHRDLLKLEAKGYISREPGIARSLRLLRSATGELFRPLEAQPARLARLPLLGNIAAGEPIHWPDSDFSPYDYETIDLLQGLVGNRQGLYALKVKGESMIDAMVYDGDIVIMQPYVGKPHDGEIVAVWLKEPGETTLKKFYWEGEKVRLQPCNPQMKPFYVDARNIEVQGKVVAVVRQLA